MDNLWVGLGLWVGIGLGLNFRKGMLFQDQQYILTQEHVKLGKIRTCLKNHYYLTFKFMHFTTTKKKVKKG